MSSPQITTHSVAVRYPLASQGMLLAKERCITLDLGEADMERFPKLGILPLNAASCNRKTLEN